MTTRRTQDKGSIFPNKDKKKPSQPDMQGECSIAGSPYEVRAWHREEQLAVTLALPRGDRNSYPPDSFRGTLDPAPKSSARAAKAREEAAPSWVGEIASEEARYAVRAFEKQGKAGSYLTLSFEALALAPVEAESASAD